MTEKIEKTEMTAGEMLRDARTNGRRKRELSTISKTLCIKEKFLDALERGAYTEIPEVVYVLGFARNYAKEVGLDDEMILKKIKAEMGIYSIQEKNAMRESQTKMRSGVMRRGVKKYWKFIVGTILALAVLCGIAIGIAELVRAVSNRGGGVEVSETVQGPKFALPPREVFGAENKSADGVALQATGESWLKVENSRGQTLFSKVLLAGDVYYAPTGARAIFGNAGAIDIWVGTVAAPRAGGDHVRVADIDLSPDALLKNQNRAL
ncbi:MAG: DUF4115 domain-containing protein [Rickettsiales bacterium]|jgi:cytoskeletal protein RodZ|nr:DUF4115 domain-containing protein [Rickettsiales bacterium]